jgi:hypothetical protein
LQRLARECDLRREAITRLDEAARGAVREFTTFLRSPRIRERLQSIKDIPKALVEIVEAPSADEAGDALVTMSSQDIKTVAKLITAAVGDKKPKTVHLRAFSPHAEFVWDAADIEGVVSEFREYLQAAWEEGCYLKLEKS